MKTSIEQLEDIQSTLTSAVLSQMSPVELNNFLLELAQHKATINEIIPQLKKEKDIATYNIIKKYQKKIASMSAATSRIFIDGETAEETQAYNFALGVSSTIERMSESIRSSLKFLAEEMRMQK